MKPATAWSADPDLAAIEDAVGAICSKSTDDHWRDCDERHEFPRLAPVSQEMVMDFVAEHVLGLPRSY